MNLKGLCKFWQCFCYFSAAKTRSTVIKNCDSHFQTTWSTFKLLKEKKKKQINRTCMNSVATKELHKSLFPFCGWENRPAFVPKPSGLIGWSWENLKGRNGFQHKGAKIEMWFPKLRPHECHHVPGHRRALGHLWGILWVSAPGERSHGCVPEFPFMPNHSEKSLFLFPQPQQYWRNYFDHFVSHNIPFPAFFFSSIC